MSDREIGCAKLQKNPISRLLPSRSSCVDHSSPAADLPARDLRERAHELAPMAAYYFSDFS